MMKKRQKYILQKQAAKVDKGKEKEAKKALNRVRIKNKKIYMTKIGRKDSDDSLAQRKHFKTLDKLKREEIVDKINADLPPYSRTFASNKAANIRPIFGINDVSMKIRSNDKGGKDIITEEISNSQLSMLNQNNIFYPMKQKGHAKATKDAPKKDRNVIFNNKTKRKVKMEGMYGISKAQKNGENGVGSYSDLLEGIPLTDNSDEEVSNGTDKFQQNSEVMFPYDSLSDTSKTGDKSNSKTKDQKKEIDSNNKDALCISEESMDDKEGQTNQSPDKGNTNRETNAAQNNATLNNDLKHEDKANIANGETMDDKKFKFGGIFGSNKLKNTKFSAKIEDGNDSPFTNENAITEFGGTITDFNIRAVLNMHLKKKNKNNIEETDEKKDE